jgi:hypothetical protein
MTAQFGQEGRYLDLIRLGRQALHEGMEFLALHNRMAMAYRALGRYEGAIPHGQRALAMYPGSPDIRRQLYNDLIACQRYQEAYWLYPQPDQSRPSSLRLQTDLVHLHAAYTLPGQYNHLIKSVLSSSSSAMDSQHYYYSLRKDSTRPYAEATLQGPSWLSGLGWGWSLTREGQWVCRSHHGYNQFNTQSTGLVQSQYVNPLTLTARDTVISKSYANTSTQFSHLMEFQSVRLAAWRWMVGWSLFLEKASYLSSQTEGNGVFNNDTFLIGLKGVDFPYSHRAYTGILGAAYRFRSAELRAGMVWANLNSDQQQQFDLGFNLWPLGNPSWHVGLDASYLNNRPAVGDVTKNGVVAMRCGMAPEAIVHDVLGKRFQGQPPRLWLEATYTGGANLRNYTRPTTLWALNSYENIRRILGLTLRWKVPVRELASSRGQWWLSATWQSQQRDQSYLALPWKVPPGSSNLPKVSDIPQRVALSNPCQFFALSLLRTFL